MRNGLRWLIVTTLLDLNLIDMAMWYMRKVNGG